MNEINKLEQKIFLTYQVLGLKEEDVYHFMTWEGLFYWYRNNLIKDDELEQLFNKLFNDLKRLQPKYRKDDKFNELVGNIKLVKPTISKMVIKKNKPIEQNILEERQRNKYLINDLKQLYN